MATQQGGVGSILLFMVLLGAAPSLVLCVRVVVMYVPGQGAAVGAALTKAGYPIHLHLQGRNFYAIDLHKQWLWLPEWLRRSKSAYIADSLVKLRKVPGVLDAVLDQKRYLVSTTSEAAKQEYADVSAISAAAIPPSCRSKNKPLSSDRFPEIESWALPSIQANSPLIQQATSDNSTETGVLICIVDSGVDATQPDLKVNRLDGCKYEDMEAPGGCPFKWDEDALGHGTHVAGIIAAARNGQQTVGTFGKGADLYIIRIYNDSGDVNQGQGFVYGSSLILAYTQCEGRLSFLQAIYPTKKYRMVVNLSLGATGPLTIEQLYFREAYSRGDILFLAAAGNNGTDPEDELQLDGTNFCSYPACYKEVLAVGASDCQDSHPVFSQENRMVDLVAPGVDILSTMPVKLSAGLRRGFLSSPDDKSIFFQMIGGVGAAGIGSATGPLVDCGAGDLLQPCKVPKGGICMFTARTRGYFNPNPKATFCDRLAACKSWGGAGVVISAPFVSLDENNKTIPFPEDVIPNISVDCSPLNCTCFKDSFAKVPEKDRIPGVTLNNVQAKKLLEALKKAAAAKKPFIVTVATAQQLSSFKSGTSMATPYASAAMARVWSAFPSCKNQEVWDAFDKTAKDLGPAGKDSVYGFGKVQMERAYLYLKNRPCAQQRAAPKRQNTTRTGARFTTEG